LRERLGVRPTTHFCLRAAEVTAYSSGAAYMTVSLAGDWQQMSIMAGSSDGNTLIVMMPVNRILPEHMRRFVLRRHLRTMPLMRIMQASSYL
jgi:hypothetical protein